MFPTSAALIGYCNETLRELVQSLDQGLKDIGVPDDKKYSSDSVFWGNATVCRLTHKPAPEFINKVKELENISIGKLKVTEINLITCNAVCSPKTREIVGTYRLK